MDQNKLEIFKTKCWRRTEIRWTDRVRNEEVLHGVKEERNILHAINMRKDNWIGQMLRRECLLQYVVQRTAGPCHQLYRAARGSPGICHFRFLSNFHE